MVLIKYLYLYCVPFAPCGWAVYLATSYIYTICKLK